MGDFENALACTSCQGGLRKRETDWVCIGCGAVYPEAGGVLLFPIEEEGGGGE